MGTVWDSSAKAIETTAALPGQISTDINVTARQGIQSTENVAGSAVEGVTSAIIDTERTVGKTVNNIAGEVGHTVKFTAKNVLALADNFQDNGFQVIQDLKSSITDTVQVTIMLGATGLGIVLILYGDKIFDRGFEIGNLELA